ncbi:MAG: hypothetical protein ABIK44_05475, partial [candidate division WOR-3 bacterium]
MKGFVVILGLALVALAAPGSRFSGDNCSPAGFDPKEVVRRVREARTGHFYRSEAERFTDDGEFLIDTSITIGPAPDWQEEPAVAFDGTNFLVVWTDDRSGSS